MMENGFVLNMLGITKFQRWTGQIGARLNNLFIKALVVAKPCLDNHARPLKIAFALEKCYEKRF